MKSLKLLLLSLTLIFTTQSAFAIISTTQTSAQKSTIIASKKKKPSVFEQYLIKKALKKGSEQSKQKGLSDGIATVLCGILAIIFFSLSASQVGLIGLLNSIILTSVAIVMVILFFIFLIRWLINKAKTES